MEEIIEILRKNRIWVNFVIEFNKGNYSLIKLLNIFLMM